MSRSFDVPDGDAERKIAESLQQTISNYQTRPQSAGDNGCQYPMIDLGVARLFILGDQSQEIIAIIIFSEYRAAVYTPIHHMVTK